jgi:choline dehydrogenase-like flavoprotein
VDEFDYLVLGERSAGCVVAGRLSEDSRVTVALLEAGGTGDGWMVNTPLDAATTPRIHFALGTSCATAGLDKLGGEKLVDSKQPFEG